MPKKPSGMPLFLASLMVGARRKSGAGSASRGLGVAGEPPDAAVTDETQPVGRPLGRWPMHCWTNSV